MRSRDAHRSPLPLNLADVREKIGKVHEILPEDRKAELRDIADNSMTSECSLFPNLYEPKQASFEVDTVVVPFGHSFACLDKIKGLFSLRRRSNPNRISTNTHLKEIWLQ